MAKNIVIIGGGVMGLCSAYYLQKEGHDVTIIEKTLTNEGASYVNAGYLTPSHIIPMASPGMISKGLRYMFNSSSPFYMKPRLDVDFIRWAWYFKRASTKERVAKAIPVIKDINILSRELFFEIKNSGELGDFHLQRKGLLMLYQSEKERDHELQVAEKAKFLGLEVKNLEWSQLKKIEPKAEINALGAIHYECDAHSTPSEFMLQMQRHLVKAGVKLQRGEEVIKIETNGPKVTKVQTDKGLYIADEVVISSGTWSSNLAKNLGLSLPMQAGKGYSLNVHSQTDITMPAILMEAKIAVTPMHGFTRFAGTMEFSGINNYIRPERVEAIAKGAAKYYPRLKIDEVAKKSAQCGLRPVSPDGLPFIGRSSKFANLTIATGHAMMGWSLGPATGKIVSDLISAKALDMNILPFSPLRKF